MDASRFDALARSVASGAAPAAGSRGKIMASRRGFLAGLVGMAAGLAGARTAHADERTRPASRWFPDGAKCSTASDCASGICSPRPGDTRGRALCQPCLAPQVAFVPNVTNGVTNGSGWQIPNDEFGNPLRQVCYSGPNSPFDPESSTCPVLKFCRSTYWAYSYLDNRVSFALVGYDLDGSIVAQREEPGARYLWQITLDPGNQLATFAGQAGGTVVEPWSDLRPSV